MFERDKEDLRRMGVPLQTVTDATHGDEIGYIIDASDAAMPAIDLTPAEAAVLAIAADYWQGAALGTDARQALTKMASARRSGAASSSALGRGDDASTRRRATLVDARCARRRCRSSTRRDARAPSCAPWSRGASSLRGGAEYLVGLRPGRDEPRTFRLSRIQGAVRAVARGRASRSPRPLRSWTRRRRGGHTPAWACAPRRATRCVDGARPSGTDGRVGRLDVPYRDTEAFATRYCAGGWRRAVIEPAALAETSRAVSSRARAAAARPGGGDDG